MTSSRRRMLTRPAWWLAAAETVVLLPFIKFMLWTRGYRRTTAWVSRRAARPRRPAASAPPLSVLAVASAVTGIARVHPLRTVCLARSVTIWWMCRQRGHEVELLMGVAAPERGELPAHAWVEYAGTPINDSADVRERYTPLPMPPVVG